MLRRILVAFDGDDGGEAVIALSQRWAQEFAATLTGIGVVDQPTTRPPERIYEAELDLDTLSKHWKDKRERVAKWLREFQQHCDSGSIPATVIEELGVPSEGILAEATRHDLILISQRFKAPESSEDTLDEVVRHAPRPVVVVPPDLKQGAFPGNSIVIGYDGSFQSSRALLALQTSGICQGRKLHIVAVNADPVRASQLADEAAEYLALHDISAESLPLPSSESPAQALLQAASDLEAQLLVLGAYGQPRLKEVLLGSVTKFLLRHAPLPLFLFH